MTQVGAPARSDPLETSTFAFATDLADEGVETVLANVQERAGLDGITPAFVYHAARDVFPHNPKRKVHLLDRRAFFFPPELALYDGLRIQPSVNPGSLAHDVLAETCRQAAARDLRVRAWTVFLHADRSGSRHPTAWGISVFLFLAVGLPVYLIHVRRTRTSQRRW